MTKLRSEVVIIKVIEIHFQHDYLGNISVEKKRYKTAKAAATEWAGYRSDKWLTKKWGHYTTWPNYDDPYAWERKIRDRLFRRTLPIFQAMLA